MTVRGEQLRANFSYCHTCKRSIGSLGIMNHRAMHRRKKEDCKITFSTGKTYLYKFSEAA